MNFRTFGKTDLKVSEVGFGGWTIGGPAMAGEIPIGWGDVNDADSINALNSAYYNGINFFDTADFYGLGHSEELIGKVFREKSNRIIVATKVGHRLDDNGKIFLDYSKDYILKACDASLRRLHRDYIDIYQLHSARLQHLEDGGCIEAMEKLKEQGKIRYWGISLNTFDPLPEAGFFISNNIGDSFQLVLNIINQTALDELIPKAEGAGYGLIARMPYQFGLLTGRFNVETRFNKNDHRNFRLTPPVIEKSLNALNKLWREISVDTVEEKANFAISFILSTSGISCTIPGIRTQEQAERNTGPFTKLSEETIKLIRQYYSTYFREIIEEMRKNG